MLFLGHLQAVSVSEAPRSPLLSLLRLLLKLLQELLWSTVLRPLRFTLRAPALEEKLLSELFRPLVSK